MVRIQFADQSVTEEPEAMNFGYKIDKYGGMTVVLVGADETTMLSVHNNVRSVWRVVDPSKPTTAFDISSLPKKD